MTQDVKTPDKWIKCISKEGHLRGVAVHATQLVQEAGDAHKLSDGGIKALGEAMVGALFFASYCKAGGRVNLNIKGSGILKQAFVDAHAEGHVRGYGVERPAEQYLFQEPTRGFWGEGFMSVLRTKDGAGGEPPYVGTVPLVTGQLAKDLTFYWLQSEQIPSAVGLSVLVKDQKVVSAGGFLIQALPGASDDEIRAIEKRVLDFSSFEQQYASDPDPLRVLSRLFQDGAFMLLEERPLQFRCNCSAEKVERALMFVEADELQSMIEQDGKANVKCDFCAKDYSVSLAELKRIFMSVSRRGR